MKSPKKPVISIIIFFGTMLALSCTTVGVYTGQHSLNEERNKDSVVGVAYAKYQERLEQQKAYQNQSTGKVVYSDQGPSRGRVVGVVLRKQAYDGPKELVAVMDFTTRDVPLSVAYNVSELIRTELINTGRFTVLERSQMREILKEQGFQQTGCTETACAVQMGKLLSARKILIGSVMKLGAKLVISGRVVDVEKGVGEQGARGKADTIDDLDNGVIEFINNLSGL